MRKAAILAGLWTMVCYALGQSIQMTPYLEREPNNSLSAPMAIESPVSQSSGFVVWEALLQPVGDRDFYRFQITEAGTYSFRVDTNRDTVLRLYNENGETLAANDNNGNPDLPLNTRASGLTCVLPPGIYTLEVFYWQNIARARYALRVFPGVAAPDYDPTEPNNTELQAIYLGRISGGEFITDEYRFLSYGSGDVDVYQFDLDSTGQTLTIHTQTYVDTALRVFAPNGQVYENNDSEWDFLNPSASEVRISLAPRGTYFVFVRANSGWGGYYRLRVSTPLPNEIILQDGDAQFRLRDLSGESTREPFNNTDWLQNGIDHFYQMGWWYRVQDVHTRELALSNLTYYDQERLNRVLLSYVESEGLILAVLYELKRTADGGSTLYADMVVINLQLQPRTIHIFHYADLDVRGETGNSADWDGDRIRIANAQDRAWLSAFTPFTRWQVEAYSSVLDLLLNDTAENLSNGTLPLEGDFTGALQWTLNLQPFDYRTVRVVYTLNTNSIPIAADVNRDGCVDDADLLEVLFNFGRTVFLQEADVNGDNMVDDLDLLEVLFYFGSNCQ